MRKKSIQEVSEEKEDKKGGKEFGSRRQAWTVSWESIANKKLYGKRFMCAVIAR